MLPAVPLQLLPDVGLPGLLVTLVLLVIAIVVLRTVLGIALKVAIAAGIVVALLWLFGVLRFVPFLAAVPG
ncbi:MAG: hypothetical protein ABEI11_03780 [Haloarculaceae archaeon]